MSTNDRRAGHSGKSSAPPESTQLETNWDDETVPGLDLDDPLNEFDRVTAIPELPSDQYVKQLMQTADESQEPERKSRRSSEPALVSLLPHEYFSLDSPLPPTEPGRAPNDLSFQNAPTARPSAATIPAPGPALRARAPNDLGDWVDLDSIGSLKADPPSLPRDAEPELEFEDTAPVEPSKSLTPIAEMKDRYAMGDFSGALVVAESILESTPDDSEAIRYAQSCRDVLTQMYSARLGSLDQIVSVAVASDQIRWLTLDHRAGFLLSLIDGGSTVDQILDISGMARLDALRIMYQLMDQRVISLGG